MTILVGPGVKVTITQYSKKAVKSMSKLLSYDSHGIIQRLIHKHIVHYCR